MPWHDGAVISFLPDKNSNKVSAAAIKENKDLLDREAESSALSTKFFPLERVEEDDQDQNGDGGGEERKERLESPERSVRGVEKFSQMGSASEGEILQTKTF